MINSLPCKPLLSKKLLRLNSVFLEARYWTKRCKRRKTVKLNITTLSIIKTLMLKYFVVRF